jgi:hypothetical protein
MLMQRAGQIANLRCQVPFVLQDGFTDTSGKKIRPIKYVADFAYTAPSNAFNRIHVVEAKGCKTPVYLQKLKMFRRRYPNIVFQEWRKGEL